MSDYHAHIYFNEMTRPQALAIRETLGAKDALGVVFGRINDGPRGPHTVPSYEIFIPEKSVSKVTRWLVEHRGFLTVLIHPLTEDEINDHTLGAVWLGPSFPLNLKALTAN